MGLVVYFVIRAESFVLKNLIIKTRFRVTYEGVI